MSAEVADVLERAAARIERDGWHQGDYYPTRHPDFTRSRFTMYQIARVIRLSGVPCCMTGAIVAESGGDTWRAARALQHILGGVLSPAVWNDAPGRTQAEVVAALRAAAEQERAS